MNSLRTLADRLISWAIDNGHVDTLGKLATNTAGLRSFVLTAASMSAAYGLSKGAWSETTVSLAVVVVSWALSSFAGYVRNQHAKELQGIVGAKKDGYVGRKTIKAAKEAVSKS